MNSDIPVNSPFNLFRTFLWNENQIESKREEFAKQNKDLAKIARLENIEFAMNMDDGQEDIDLNILPPNHFKCKQFYQNLGDISVDYILEKYVVLSYLYNDDFLRHLSFGVKYFDQTIFRDLFKDMSHSEILQRISEINKKYKDLFDKLHNWEITRIMKLDYVGHRRDTYTINYSRSANQFMKDERPTKYLHSVFDENEQLMSIFFHYCKQIEKVAYDDFNKDLIDYSIINDIKKFLKGQFTIRNIQSFKFYFIKINADEGLLNLPQSFKEHKNVLVSRILQNITDKYIYLKANKDYVKGSLLSQNNIDDFEWEEENDKKIWEKYSQQKLSSRELAKLSLLRKSLTIDFEKQTKKFVNYQEQAVKHNFMFNNETKKMITDEKEIEKKMIEAFDSDKFDPLDVLEFDIDYGELLIRKIFEW